jgi:hypothetical protein
MGAIAYLSAHGSGAGGSGVCVGLFWGGGVTKSRMNVNLFARSSSRNGRMGSAQMIWIGNFRILGTPMHDVLAHVFAL